VVNASANFLPWRIATRAVEVNGKPVNSSASSIAFNTANMYVEGPSQQIATIMNELGASNVWGIWVMDPTATFSITWTFPSTSGEGKTDVAGLTSLTLTEKELLVPTMFGKQYAAVLLTNIEDTQLPEDEKTGWIFGTSSLSQKYYLVLDYDAKTVGLAESIKNNETAQPSSAHGERTPLSSARSKLPLPIVPAHLLSHGKDGKMKLTLESIVEFHQSAESNQALYV
jgi:hypothetical protein